MPNMMSLRGPHGIPLIAHARRGGPQAAAVVTFLETLPASPVTQEPLARKRSESNSKGPKVG